MKDKKGRIRVRVAVAQALAATTGAPMQTPDTLAFNFKVKLSSILYGLAQVLLYSKPPQQSADIC